MLRHSTGAHWRVQVKQNQTRPTTDGSQNAAKKMHKIERGGTAVRKVGLTGCCRKNVPRDLVRSLPGSQFLGYLIALTLQVMRTGYTSQIRGQNTTYVVFCRTSDVVLPFPLGYLQYDNRHMFGTTKIETVDSTGNGTWNLKLIFFFHIIPVPRDE